MLDYISKYRDFGTFFFTIELNGKDENENLYIRRINFVLCVVTSQTIPKHMSAHCRQNTIL